MYCCNTAENTSLSGGRWGRENESEDKASSWREVVVSTFLPRAHCAETGKLFHLPAIQVLRCSVPRIIQTFSNFYSAGPYLLHGVLTNITVWFYATKGVTPSKGMLNREDNHEMAQSSRTTISMRKMKYFPLKARKTLGRTRTERNE